MTVRLPKQSTINQAGGFGYTSSNKHVCQIMQIDTYEETGCIITGITTDSASILFTIISSGTLSSSNLYKMTITTHTGSQP